MLNLLENREYICEIKEKLREIKEVAKTLSIVS